MSASDRAFDCELQAVVMGCACIWCIFFNHFGDSDGVFDGDWIMGDICTYLFYHH